jgi:hypothetical protein
MEAYRFDNKAIDSDPGGCDDRCLAKSEVGSRIAV